MSRAKTIFLGWVDLSPEGWSLWGYDNKETWASVISDLIWIFRARARVSISPAGGTTAKNANDDNGVAGNDLYVKFADVSIDHNYYGLRLSIHFIDPRTNTEIASIPSRLYYEKRWFKFQLYMRAALDDIGTKVQAEVTRAPRK